MASDFDIRPTTEVEDLTPRDGKELRDMNFLTSGDQVNTDLLACGDSLVASLFEPLH